jgi:PKD repeat protein
MKSNRVARGGLILLAGIALCALVACVGCAGGGATNPAEPVITATADPIAGFAPMDVTVNCAVALSDGTTWLPTKMGIDWGAYNSQETVTGLKTTFTYRYTLPGTYEVLCWAIDDRTGKTVETTTTVQVLGINNTPPACTLTADPVTGAAPLLVRFTGTGADPDGSIVSWTLDFGDGSREWTDTAPPTGRGHVYTSAGVYRASLTARDDYGATALVRETITVTAAAP